MSSSLVHDPKNNTKEKAVANDNKNFFILVYIQSLDMANLRNYLLCCPLSVRFLLVFS